MDYQITPSYDSAAGVWNAALSGEFDIFNADQLKAELNALINGEGSANLVLDFKEVTFLDSTALGALVAVLKNAKTHDGSIKIVNPKPSVHKLFKITNLTASFEIGGGEDE